MCVFDREHKLVWQVSNEELFGTDNASGNALLTGAALFGMLLGCS